ncbi:MAG: protein kinase [Candidatus Competibacteraceae bacterium]|nr:protein kinase [Candidatus Competibacteraceae bacterium]
MSTEDTRIVTGTTPTIPGYHIEGLLGSGAMGQVYLATQKALERAVAIKVIMPAYSSDEEFRLRFLKEGRIIAKLRHPHIVTIHDIGERQGYYYMVMEYVDGGTLKERIQQGLSADQAIALFRQIASALGYAHRQGFIHRDIKPANILFHDQDTAVLSDFGIAKDFEDSVQLTATGLAIGTLMYMSPEQTRGQPLDTRSDLYSLGLVFYEMLAGHRPDRSEGGFIEPLPAELSRYQGILDRLLARDPNDRFETAEQCIAALDQLPPTPITSALPVSHTVLKRVSLVSLALALCLAVGYYFWQQPSETPLSLDVSYSYRPADQLNFRPLVTGSALHSGDHYQIRFVPAEAGYVYIFQIDSSGAVYRLFPLSGSEAQASGNINPVSAGTSYFVPAEGKAFQLDEQVGQERIVVLAFKNLNIDLETLYATLAAARQMQDSQLIAETQRQLKQILQDTPADAIPVLNFEHLSRGDHAI